MMPMFHCSCRNNDDAAWRYRVNFAVICKNLRRRHRRHSLCAAVLRTRNRGQSSSLLKPIFPNDSMLIVLELSPSLREGLLVGFSSGNPVAATSISDYYSLNY